jgi:hypothetical protein
MKLGFFTSLTLLFIGLKLTNYVDWSWFMVLSPMIAGFVLWAIIVTIVVAVDSKYRG